MTVALILAGALFILVASVAAWATLAVASYRRAKRANTVALFLAEL